MRAEAVGGGARGRRRRVRLRGAPGPDPWDPLFLLTVVAPTVYGMLVQVVWWWLGGRLPESWLFAFLVVSTAGASYGFSRFVWSRVRAIQGSLLAERQRWHNFAEHAPEAILVLDGSGRVRTANRAAATLLDVTAQQRLQGRHCSEFTLCEGCAPGREAEDCPLKHVAAGETIHRGVTVRPASGHAFAAWAGFTAWRLPSGREVALTIEDLRTFQQLQEEVAVLAERNRLARELHDGIGQFLGIIGLRLDQARQLLRKDQTGGVENELQACSELVSSAFGEVRRAIADLSLPLTGGGTFCGSLSRYLEDYGRDTGLRIEPLFATGDVPHLPPPVEIQLIRIVQEALTNVRRHAGATRVQVLVDRPEGGPLVVSVADDGVGFRPEDLGPAAFGLASMRERARLVGGACSIRSLPGHGTQVTVTIPEGRSAGEDRTA